MNPSPPFNNELGNRVTFGLIIDGNGTKISLSELTFTMSSGDPADGLAYSDNYLNYDYNSAHVGVINGPGGPTFVTGGDDTVPVDEILMVGVGNAFWAGVDENGNPLPEDQWAQSMSDTAAYISGSVPTISITYTLTDATSHAILAQESDTIDAVPEPATLSLMVFGLASAMVARRKQLRRK
jgi:hypothetical protein